MTLHLRVKAGSKLNRVSKDGEGNWVMKVRVAPIDGKANDELIRFLSTTLSLPKSKIRILSGHALRLRP